MIVVQRQDIVPHVPHSHAVLVRHRQGSIAAQSPLFANHRCIQNQTDFYEDARQRLRSALADGHAQTGPPLDDLFVQPRDEL